MKDITKIRLNNLKDAEYMIISIIENSGHVFVESFNHSFTEMLDVMKTDNNIDEAAEDLDIPVMGEITVTEEFQIDPKMQDFNVTPMLIIRVK